MASISKQPKEMQERHKRVLNGMLKLPENRECADCRARNPTWASTNLGVFVCIRCSGLHRQVGVHITKVKSCTMDLWAPEQIAHIQKLGNGIAKRIYEAKLPANYGKPAESEDSALVLQWIRAKYEKKKFMHDNPQGVIDAASSASAAAGGSAATAAAGPGGEAPRALPGRARRDRQPQQQQQPVKGGFGVDGGGFGSDDGGFTSGGGFGFDSSSSTQTAPSGFTTDANGGGFGAGFGFADASSADGTASPAFGTMPGTAFGFVASPVAPSSPRDGLGSAALPQPRGEDSLDFSYATGGAGGAAKPPAAAAPFDPFAEVDTAAQQQPKYAAGPSTGSAASGTASPTVPMAAHGTSIGTVFQAPAPDAAQGGGDFEAQMRSMQQQLATQQAYLDSLQQQSGVASA
jgi:hypothetical protein